MRPLLPRRLLLCLALLVPASTALAKQTPNVASFRLASGCGGEPSIAAGAANLVVVTGRGDSCSATTGPVTTWVSHDGGRSFGPRQGVGPSSLGDYDSDVAVDSSTGAAYVAQGGGVQLALCRSTDGGRTWQQAPDGHGACADQVGAVKAVLVDRPWVLTGYGATFLGWTSTFPPQNPVTGAKTSRVPTWVRYDSAGTTLLPPLATAGPSLGTAADFAVTSRPALGRGGSLLQLLVGGAVMAPQPAALVEPTCRLLAVRLGRDSSAWTAVPVLDVCAQTQTLLPPAAGFPVMANDGHGAAAAVAIGHDSPGAPLRPYIARSSDDGRHWGPAVALATDGQVAKPAAVVVNGTLYAAWYISRPGGSWDYQVVRVDRSGRAHQLARVGPVHRGALDCGTCVPNDLSSLAASDGALLASYDDESTPTPTNVVLRIRAH